MTHEHAERTLASASVRLQQAGTELLERACAQAGVRLVGQSLRSVHHREGRSVSHVYEATLGHGDTTVAALLVAHADVRPPPDGALVLEHGGDRVAVWRFPHDPYLPGLPSAVDLGRMRELLDRLGVGPGQVHLRTRAYRPARRAVVEATVAGDGRARRVLYCKVLSGDRAEGLADRHRQLREHVPVPAVVGVAPRQGILALQALPGRTLRDALTAREPVPAAEELVALSRRLMASGLVSDRSPRDFADPVRHVARLCDLAPEASDTIRRVADAAGRIDGPDRIVHGDLHAGQLLVEQGQLTGLLDVDGAGTGLLAQDAGTLVAYLQVLGELQPDVRDHVEAYAREVGDAYAELVGQRDLARGTAGAWLALATAAHRSQEPAWPETTRRRIARAADALDG